MSFTIRLSQDLTTVEAGATVPLSIEITGKGEEIDRFEMQVEGLDPEWTALPEPVFNVGPGETQSQKVFFKPPRASESLAGNYPFVVKVRSLNSGDARTAQGVLQIKAFHHLSMELSPKKGYSTPTHQAYSYTLTVMNLGNTEHTLQLSGADPEEECAYDFPGDQITIGPGQQKEVPVSVHAASAGYFSSSKLYGFVISARSIQNPNIVASAQGQLERRPLLSPATLLTAVLLIAAFLLWFAVRPKPPTITAYPDSSRVIRGQTIHVSWRAANAQSVKLEIRRNNDDKAATPEPPETDENLPLEGTKDIVATNAGTITIRATAVGENKSQEANPVTILVNPPPTVHNPTISSFKASRQKIKLGESVIFTFDYSPDVTKLVLSPMTTQQIPLPAKQVQITPTEVGDVEYQLLAYNAQGGETNSKTVTVEVYQASDASIVQFEADPKEITAPDTKTTIKWNVTNAALVQLDDGTGSGPKTIDAVGSMDVVTDKSVKLKLIATDSKGVTTSMVLSIKYKPLPPPPTDTTGTIPPITGGPTTTGKTTGGN